MIKVVFMILILFLFLIIFINFLLVFFIYFVICIIKCWVRGLFIFILDMYKVLLIVFFLYFFVSVWRNVCKIFWFCILIFFVCFCIILVFLNKGIFLSQVNIFDENFLGVIYVLLVFFLVIYSWVLFDMLDFENEDNVKLFNFFFLYFSIFL